MGNLQAEAEVKRLERFFVQESPTVEIMIRQQVPRGSDIVIRHVITKAAFDSLNPDYLYGLISLSFGRLQIEAEEARD